MQKHSPSEGFSFAHIVVTLEPEQVTPSQYCPQGSPFWDTQFVSWGGEFMVV